MIEARDVLVMAEDHDSARIVGARLDDRAQPVDEFIRQRAIGLDKMLDDRRADGIVASVEREDAPMIVLEAEIARPLAVRAPANADLWKDVIEVAESARQHFVVAVERKRAFRSPRPFARLVGEARIAYSEEICSYLRRIPDIVDVAEVDRVVRSEFRDPRGDVERLVGACSPVARESDSDLVGSTGQPIDAIVSVAIDIGLERMAPAIESTVVA